MDPALIGTIGTAVKELSGSLAGSPETAGLTEVERATVIVMAGLMTFVPPGKMVEYIGTWKANCNVLLKDPATPGEFRALGK